MINISQFGHSGVHIFFVLSGFVIALTLRDKFIDIPTFSKFVLRRSIRIDIPYIGALALMCAFLLIQWKFGTHANLPTIHSVVAHLFYLQDILEYEPINIVFWTLCIEIQFYLFYCFVLGAIQAAPSITRRSISIVIFTSIFLFSIIVKYGYLKLGINGLFLPFWYEFSLGVFACWLLLALAKHDLLVAMGVILLAVSGIWSSDSSSMLVAVVTTCIIYYAGRTDRLGSLSHPWFQFFGRISYSLYLVHVPVSGFILALRNRISPDSELSGLLFWWIAVLSSIVVATIFHKIVEAPAIRLSKYFR